jgi:hypothetical protein
MIRISESRPMRSAITVDIAVYRIYRRNRREVVPLIHRPEM